MSIGDVYWVDLPGANGHEQRGRRPAIIVQHPSYGDSLPVVLVVPLTTSRAALRFPATVLIRSSRRNGLPRPSVALVFQLRAIDRHRIRDRIGSVGPQIVAQLLEALDRLTGRESR